MKINQPIFHIHLSVAYIFKKYLIYDKIPDKKQCFQKHYNWQIGTPRYSLGTRNNDTYCES